jgi:tetraacyldisaccharide 4'-kinase
MKLKKPRFWDQKKPNLYAFLFYPLAIFIQLLNSLKNKVPKNNFKIKTICLGNIYIGGTGKTSLCITLKNILDKKNIRSCFIKKFYKDQYDEQKLLKQNGKLFLEKKRVDAIQKAEEENYEIAILDDGLQDKSINSDINIVCFNNINWIGNGMTIPAGPLREKINNLQKYDHIFLNGNLENIDNIKKKILSINSRSNIYIGKYEVTNIIEFNKQDNYFVFSGIGNHASFILMLKNEGLKIINHLEFPDHYQYTISDINKIVKKAKNLNCKIITTEKDYLRLENLNISEIKVVKSSIKIINEENFLKAIL